MRLIDADEFKKYYARQYKTHEEFDILVDMQPTIEPERAGYIKLPCNIGDIVYWTAGMNVPMELVVNGFEIGDDMSIYLDVGKTLPINADNPYLFFNKDEAIKSIGLGRERR